MGLHRTLVLVLVVMGTVAAWTVPAVAQDREAPRLLFLTHAGLYRHASLGPAERVVAELGRESGFEVVTVEGYLQDPDSLDLEFLTAEYLTGFDGLMMMTNGNLPLSEAQRDAILDFVRDGGGFVGVHNAALTLYAHPGFGDMLGGYFQRTVAQNRPFVLRVEQPDHPATRMLEPGWEVVDEFYIFGTGVWDPERPEEHVDDLFGNRIPVAFSRDRVTVLLSIDTERSDLDGLPHVSVGGDYPQAWYRDFGAGRSFYTALGHRTDLWEESETFRAHLLGGIRWALELED